MTAKEIELHPGHWKRTGSGANGIINEVTEARKVTKRVYEILRASNVPTTYFEDNASVNQTQNINALVKEHNKDTNGLVVSIHFNASGGTTDRGIGTEVLYYDQKELAQKLVNAISGASRLLNRGAKHRTDLGVLASTYEPAVLIEVCFVNSNDDVARYKLHFEAICQAIAKELALYVGKSLVVVKPQQKEETSLANSLTSTAKADLKGLLKETHKRGIMKVDHSNRVDRMTDSEALGLLISVVKRTL